MTFRDLPSWGLCRDFSARTVETIAIVFSPIDLSASSGPSDVSLWRRDQPNIFLGDFALSLPDVDKTNLYK